MGERARHRLVRVALVAAGSVVALLAGELVLWAFDYPGPLPQDWLLRSDAQRNRVFDARTLFARPEFYEDEHYRVEPGTKVVVALGDSFTEGTNVAKADSFVARLQRCLDEAELPATVIDMGLGYSGNDQHRAILEHFVLPRLRPDVVVWQHCYNDVQDHVDLSIYAADGGELVCHGAERNWLYVRERLDRSVPRWLGCLRSTRLWRLALSATGRLRMRVVPERYREDLTAYGWHKAALLVDAVEELSERHGFELVFTRIVPQMLHVPSEARPESLLTDFLEVSDTEQGALLASREHYVEVRFTRDDLEAARAAFGVSGALHTALFLGADRDREAFGMRHHNEAGCRVFAEKVARYLCAHRDRLFR